MHRSLVLTLRTGATIVDNGRDVDIQLWHGTRRLSSPSTAVRRALQLLERGAERSALARIVVETGGDSELPVWQYQCARLEECGAVSYELRATGRPLARALVTSSVFSPGFAGPSCSDRRTLDRFAYIRRADTGFVLESARSSAQISLLDPVCLPLVSALGGSIASDELPDDTSRDLLALFEFCGMLAPARDAEHSEPGPAAASDTWHFADLLSHARSRARRDIQIDALPGQRSRVPSEVAKAPMSANIIDLHAPNADDLITNDVPFSRVMSQRRSIREYDTRPITAARLGEFLYRVARIEGVNPANGDELPYATSRRPYPGGGACYELEIYTAIEQCDGLARGLYHYDPMGHRLEVLPTRDAQLDRLLADARRAMGVESPRQVLCIISARFHRVMWKYGLGSYALIMKNTGVLLDTMYLVATAMGLAPCAIGGGDSELFASAIGAEFEVETSVGEFMLGTRQPMA